MRTFGESQVLPPRRAADSLFVQIDMLDAAIQNMSDRIEYVLAPHAEIVEVLCTIPGVQAHAAQVLIAECGLDMSLFPTVGHFARPGPVRARVTTSQPDDAGLVARAPDRGG